MLKCVNDLVLFFFHCSGVCPERGSVRAIISYSYVKHFVQSFTSASVAFTGVELSRLKWLQGDRICWNKTHMIQPHATQGRRKSGIIPKFMYMKYKEVSENRELYRIRRIESENVRRSRRTGSFTGYGELNLKMSIVHIFVCHRTVQTCLDLNTCFNKRNKKTKCNICPRVERDYSPWWTLASTKIVLHCSRSCYLRPQSLTPVFFLEWLKPLHLKFSYASSAFWFKKVSFLQGSRSCIL